jgi:hypothetical protein
MLDSYGGKSGALGFMHSQKVPLADKDARIDEIERILSEQYLQYCDPLDPLHLLIQIGLRSYLLAARRGARQPALINAKISTMSARERHDFLKICKKSLEYYILSETTESLKGFRWHNENHFQCAACKQTRKPANCSTLIV